MYLTDGDFGQVRTSAMLPVPDAQGLFSFESIGWHRCNDRYCITRPGSCDSHLLMVTMKGRGVLRLEGVEYSLPAGSIALVPRNRPNSYFTPAGGLWEFYWIHTSGGASTAFLDTLARKGVYVTEFEPEYDYAQQFEMLMQLCSEREQGFEWQISRQLSELLHRVAIQFCGQPSATSLSNRAIRLIRQHYKDSVTLDEIAQALFVSTAHFIRAFKKETGLTPHQYLNRYRLVVATQLLEYSDRRVEEIAAEVGFSSSSHFISSFHRQYGYTPLHYREQLASKKQ